MSTEEVYFRSFVTAAALAAVVAFLVIAIGFLLRKKLRGGLEIVGGLALALAWIAAHQAMRGSQEWADLARGGDGWARAFWPPAMTGRFSAFVVFAAIAGVIAHLIAGRTTRGWTAARWVVRIVSMGAITWVISVPTQAWDAPPSLACPVTMTLLGVGWWWALERPETSKHRGLVPATMALVSTGFGILLLMQYAIGFGLVAISGAVAMCVIAMAAIWDPRFAQGPMLCAVAAGGWVALTFSAMLYAESWPALTYVLAFGAPLSAGIPSKRWMEKRPAWNGWVAQLGLAAGLLALAAFVVFWIEHHSSSTRI